MRLLKLKIEPKQSGRRQPWSSPPSSTASNPNHNPNPNRKAVELAAIANSLAEEAEVLKAT